MDDFLSLFKNQISLYDLRYNITFKEAIKMRDIRLKRLQQEAKDNPAAGLSDIAEDLG